ncbi:MAG: TldD/PmbA family protein [Clostridiales bacterium]|nr:TldD/PmbA family protein [Clostridiales bacterium]
MIKQSVIQNVLFEALSLGGDFAEIFIENRFNNSFQMIGGKIEKGLKGRDFGIGVRIYFGTNSVYTYTNNLEQDNLVKMVRKAVYMKKNNDKVQVMPFIEVFTKDRHHIKNSIQGNDFEKIELMKKISQAAFGYDEVIKQVVANYVDYKQEIIIANSEGMYIEDQRNRTRLMVSASAESKGDIQTGSMNKGAHQGFEFYENVDIDYMGKEASRIAKTALHSKYAPSGKMPVVIDNGFGGVLFHEASGHGLEATSVAKGISVYSGKKGQKIASELVTAIDDGTIANAWGSQNVDDEGIATQKNILIEKGILKSYLIDRLNGRIMGEKSTGSGRRQSYKFAPTSRMTNTYIDNGESTFNEIIEDTEYGLYTKYMGGGSVNPATGEFNFAVMEGYMIRNGKIAEAVRGATLIGTGFEALENIDKVGNNLEHGQGMCGSASGSIPVNVGQPTIRIKSMTVGGRSEER